MDALKSMDKLEKHMSKESKLSQLGFINILKIISVISCLEVCLKFRPIINWIILIILSVINCKALLEIIYDVNVTTVNIIITLGIIILYNYTFIYFIMQFTRWI